MKNSLYELLSGHNLLNHIIAICIAVFGGLTKFLMDDNHSVFKLILALSTAGFAGWICFLFCREYAISQNLTAIFCGISGLSGETFLRLMQKSYEKWLKEKIFSMDDEGNCKDKNKKEKDKK